MKIQKSIVPAKKSHNTNDPNTQLFTYNHAILID